MLEVILQIAENGVTNDTIPMSVISGKAGTF